jgi:hypothetical protein
MSMSPLPHDSVAPGSAHQYRTDFNPLRFCLPAGPTAEQRRALIAKAAYFRAQRRGFRAGHELDDWLAAEAEVEQQLADPRRRRGHVLMSERS